MTVAASRSERWAMVIARDRGLLTAEPFWLETADGIEDALRGTNASFYLHQVPTLGDELAAYTRWAGDVFVDGVILVNPLTEDPRPALVDELGLSCLHAGTEHPLPGSTAISSSNGASMRRVLERLRGMGHRRVARISGPESLAHTRIRTAIGQEVASVLSIELTVLAGDYSWDSGRAGIRALLTGDQAARPTAVIFDNDTMALAGLEEALAEGLKVPEDISLVAWDDSPACQLASPPLTAIGTDVRAFGHLIGECVLRINHGERGFIVPEPAHHWLQRASVSEVPLEQ